jgi:hypothetical protein
VRGKCWHLLKTYTLLPPNRHNFRHNYGMLCQMEGMPGELTPAWALPNAFQVRLDVATPRVRLAGWPGASPSFMATRRA